MKQVFLAIFLSISLTANSQELLDFQYFTVDCRIDTILKCKLGTEIHISKGSFIKQNGDSIISEPVQIKVKEAFGIDEMVLEKLSTESKDGLLVSNGMVQIEGYLDEEIVQISDNDKVKVSIPSFDGSTSMKIYTLNEDNKPIWKESETKVKFDSCQGYKEKIIWEAYSVTKEEYKRWEKNNPVEMQPERMFGGRTIEIGFRSKKEYYIEVPVDTIWECENGAVAYYSFNIKEFGWYNIDKLKEIKNKTKLNVKTEEDLAVFLIFDKLNVCIRAYQKPNGIFSFELVPDNKAAYLVAYKQIDSDFINVSIQEIYTSQKLIELKKSSKMSVGAFKKMMRELL